MQNSKEWQGEIRKSSSVNNAKKQRKQQNGKDISSRKLRDSKGIFHAKMGSIKDRNGMDLTEAEDIIEEVTRIHRRTVQKRSSQPI